ncbi:MAG: ACT domain-containing protein [Caldisphaera sp.]|nr:hypothetical protein [Caldisphaera sp.]PMP60810.1 MAG: hypothetical protein C0201_01615 [Caldisphaera sp.]PMP92267.1 MAG: hypothetical protein C0171_01015 [Caldisphaera sp.]
MTQGKLIRVLGYYRDAGLLERVLSNFRKLLIDIDWVNARKLNNDVYEIYLYVNESPNLKLALLNLSKTVDIEFVELYEYSSLTPYVYKNNEIREYSNEDLGDDYFMFFIPIGLRKSKLLSWGEFYG